MKEKILILAISLILSCNSNTMLNEQEFTNEFITLLESKYPNIQIEIINELHIRPKLGDYEYNQFLNNAYLEYKLEPDSLKSILSDFSKILDEKIHIESGEIDTKKIVPIIKDNFFLEESNSNLADQNNKQVSEKYNEELVIIYAEDRPNTINYFSKDDLLKKNVNSDNLKKLAKENLLNQIATIESQQNNGIYMLLAGGTYESSLILISSIWTKENFDVKGDIVIGIPNRDVVLICGDEDVERVLKIREMTKNMFNENSYAVSDKLFRWNDKDEKFVVYE